VSGSPLPPPIKRLHPKPQQRPKKFLLYHPKFPENLTELKADILKRIIVNEMCSNVFPRA